MRGKALRILLLSGTALTMPVMEAQAEPASFIAVATAVASATATATISNAVLAAIVSTAIAIAGSLAASFFRQQDTAQQGQLRAPRITSHPARQFAFGEFEQSGQLVFRYVKDGSLYETRLLNELPSQSIDRIKLWDEELTFYDDASNDLYDMALGANTNVSPWNEELYMWIGLGDQTQFPQRFIDELGDIIPANASWNGKTVVHTISLWGSNKTAPSRWRRGWPVFKFLGKWSKLYDPRLDSTSGVTGASGSHRWADPSTWEYTNGGTEIGANPALQALTLILHENALGAAEKRVLIQMFADAADDCEVEDGSVSEVQLAYQDWTSAPSAQVIETDPGSGVWTYSRGTVAVGAKDEPTLGGTNSLKLHSTDTGGSVDASETGRVGAHWKMASEGRSGDETYSFRFDTNAAGTVGQATYRVRVIAGYKGSSGDNADEYTNHLPPDATNITEVYDSGLQTITGPGFTKTHTVSGDYVSLVLEGGEPNESDTEWREVTVWTTAQGGKQRFRSDGVIEVKTREWSLLTPVLDAMAGTLDTTRGYIGVRAGVWDAPSVTLSDPIDALEYEARSYVGFDKLKATYISRVRDYEETETETPYTLYSGDREENIQLPMVREPEQAHRLTKIEGERAKLNRSLKAVFSGVEWPRRIGQRVTVAWEEFPQADGTYRVVSYRPVAGEVDGRPQINIELGLREDAAATYSWTSGDYNEPDAVSPETPATPTMDDPTSVTAAQQDYRTSYDSTARARLDITVANSASVVSHGGDVVVETSNDGGTTWTRLGVYAPESSLVVSLSPVVTGVTYKARARNESDSLGISDWVESSGVTITTPSLDFNTSDFSAEFG